MNVGSRTRGANETKGVWDYSLTTRPINDLLSKIEKKEEWLLKNKIIPSVTVCGAGAAGVELAFGFKARWDKVFNTDINVSLLSADDKLFKDNESLRHEIEK